MWKEFLNSKWYWYLPLIGLLYVGRMAEWIFDSDCIIKRYNRYNALMFFWMLVQTITILAIVGCTM